MDSIPANMHARLELEFSQDRLFRIAQKNKHLKEQLIDEYMAELDELKEYTTTDFEAMYCDESKPETFLATPSTMRRWLKELNEYIEGDQRGRKGNFKLNYQSMFRLRMVLLFRKEGYRIDQISHILGIKVIPEVVEEEEYMPATPARDQEEITTQLFSAIAMKMVQEGWIRLDPEKGPVLNIPALPGEIEQRIAATQEQMKNLAEETKKEINSLEDKIQNQKKQLEKQEQMIKAMSEIYEAQLIYEETGAGEDLLNRMKSLKKEDPEAYLNAMMELIKQARERKMKKNFWRRLFNK